MPNSTKVHFTNYFTIKQDFKDILISKYMLLVFVNTLFAKAGRRTADKLKQYSMFRKTQKHLLKWFFAQ